MKNVNYHNRAVFNTGKTLVYLLFYICMSHQAFAQENIFFGLQSDQRKADFYYLQKNYYNALKLYLNLEKRNKTEKETQLKIANSFYELNNYTEAIVWYKKYTSGASELPPDDLIKFAEALNATSAYEESVKLYKAYLEQSPNDRLVLNKVWRLKNIQFLYEDSSYYSVSPLSVNSEYGEIAPCLYNGQLVFLSNRKGYRVLGKSDATTNEAFYRTYITPLEYDSASGKTGTKQAKTRLFASELKPVYHQGPVAFYDNGNKMLCILDEASNKNHTLKLHFVENVKGKWKIIEPFPYNSSAYSIYAATINEEGTLMYLASDMKGGKGGTDLYVSTFKEGKWTKPQNLGDEINTSLDEMFPFYHQNYLFFSSNGHAGLGGLDIFKAAVDSASFGEVINLGYPLNTNHDEFAFHLNDKGTIGYFSSNRKNGGLDDDLYEVEMKLQSYPYTIHGILKYKTTSLNSPDLKILPNTSLELIDLTRNLTIQKSISDASGHFSFEIPYFSQYKIYVKESDGSETVVSLDISKLKKTDTNHEVVIVKDDFDMEKKIKSVKD